MDTQVSLKKWILTCFSVLAVALFMVGCGGSSSGGGGGGDAPKVEAVPQVQLSGLVTKQTVGGASLSPAAIDAPILLIAVDQNGNTSTAIVATDGEYEIMVSSNTPNSLMIFDLGTMSFIGALLSEEGLGAFTLNTNTADVDFEVDDDGTVNVATASQTILTVTTAPQKLQEAFDPATGIDTTKLQADITKVQHIALTDFLPRTGTWTTGYDHFKESGSGTYEGVSYSFTYEDIERDFSITYRDGSNNLRRVYALFYEYWSDTYSVSADNEECGGFFAGPLETGDCGGYYHGTALAEPGIETETFAETYIVDAEEGVIFFGSDDDAIPLPIQMTAGVEFSDSDTGLDSWGSWTYTIACTPNIMGSFNDNDSNNVNVLRLRCTMTWEEVEEGEEGWSDSGSSKIDVYMLSRYGSFIVVPQGTSNWQNLVASHIRFGTFDLATGAPFTDRTPTSISGVSVSGAIPGNPSSGNTADMRNTWLQELWDNRDSIY